MTPGDNHRSIIAIERRLAEAEKRIEILRCTTFSTYGAHCLREAARSCAWARAKAWEDPDLRSPCPVVDEAMASLVAGSSHDWDPDRVQHTAVVMHEVFRAGMMAAADGAVAAADLRGAKESYERGKAEGVVQVQAYAEKEARAAEMRAGLIPQEADSNNAVAYAARSIARKATTEHSDALTSMLAEARKHGAGEALDVIATQDEQIAKLKRDVAEARAEGERRAWTAAERLIETSTKLGSEMPFPSPTVGGLLEGFAEARHNLPSAISGLLRAAEERTKQR